MKFDIGRSETGKFNIVMSVVIVSLAVLAFISTLTFFFTPHESGNRTGEADKLKDFSSGWKNESGITMSLNGMIDSKDRYTADAPLKIYKSYNDIGTGDMLYIHSRNLVINVYADSLPLYITDVDSGSKGISGFDNYIMVGLPSGTGTENLALTIYNTDYNGQCAVNKILVGPESTIIRKLLGENVFPVISSVIFIVIGIALVIFGASTRKKIDDYLSSIYFGIFLIIISLGAVFDTSWAHIVCDNVAYAENSQRIFLSAALPAFLAFIDTFFVTEHNYPVKIACILSCICVPTLLILNNIGVISLIEIGIYYLIFTMACGIVVIVELMMFMVRTRGSGGKRLRRQFVDYLGVYIFIVSCLIDIVIFLSFSVNGDDLFFTRLGLFVISAITLIALFGEILNMIKLGVQAGRIGKIAFTDANTGIGNVAAFKAQFEELEAKKFSHRYIGIVQFDVNNLKVINDSKGHEAGDLLIKSAADIINKSFGVIGNCYRTGGDEFVALIVSEHAPIECEEAIYNFNKLIDKFNSKDDRPFDLRIAYGIAYYQNDKTSEKTLREIHKTADERMYENKKMLKQRYAKNKEEAEIR